MVIEHCPSNELIQISNFSSPSLLMFETYTNFVGIPPSIFSVIFVCFFPMSSFH